MNKNNKCCDAMCDRFTWNSNSTLDINELGIGKGFVTSNAYSIFIDHIYEFKVIGKQPPTFFKQNQWQCLFACARTDYR